MESFIGYLIVLVMLGAVVVEVLNEKATAQVLALLGLGMLLGLVLALRSRFVVRLQQLGAGLAALRRGSKGQQPERPRPELMKTARLHREDLPPFPVPPSEE